jgi:hypothetical protein
MAPMEMAAVLLALRKLCSVVLKCIIFYIISPEFLGCYYIQPGYQSGGNSQALPVLQPGI